MEVMDTTNKICNDANGLMNFDSGKWSAEYNDADGDPQTQTLASQTTPPSTHRPHCPLYKIGTHSFNTSTAFSSGRDFISDPLVEAIPITVCVLAVNKHSIRTPFQLKPACALVCASADQAHFRQLWYYLRRSVRCVYGAFFFFFRITRISKILSRRSLLAPRSPGRHP